MVDDDDIEDKPKKKQDDFMGMSWGQVGAIAGGTALALGIALAAQVFKPNIDQVLQQQKNQQLMIAQAQQQAMQAQAQQMAAAQQQPEPGASQELNLTQEPQPRKSRIREIEEPPITDGTPQPNYIGVSV